MAQKRVTTRDVLEAITNLINTVETNAPNGTLDRLSDKIDALSTRQDTHRAEMNEVIGNVHECVRKLEKRLYNPDNGVVVQVRDNTKLCNEVNKNNEEYLEKFHCIQRSVSIITDWKKSLTRGFWVLLPILLSGAVAMIWLFASGK